MSPCLSHGLNMISESITHPMAPGHLSSTILSSLPMQGSYLLYSDLRTFLNYIRSGVDKGVETEASSSAGWVWNDFLEKDTWKRASSQR